jgi:uncharacterized membrane protein YeaQ/YmgE (transglycosylase-associated protein family)
MLSISNVIVWLIIGLLAGSLAGPLLTGKREGFGRVNNLVVGLVGAILGGGIFRLFGIDLGLGSIAVSAEDLVSALVGSVILILVVRIVKRRSGKAAGSSVNPPSE